MRATLGQMEAVLAKHGIARTHRGWLVNTAAIAETRRVGAGDFELTLSGGLVAPLSRRWRHAVEAARGD
jgi:DNA-binding LytR/AlgR family response regulator